MSDRPHQLSNLVMRFTLIYGVHPGQLALEEDATISLSRTTILATPALTSCKPKTKLFKHIITLHHGRKPNTESKSRRSDQIAAVNTLAALSRNSYGEKVWSAALPLMTLPSTTASRNLLTAVYLNKSKLSSIIPAYQRHCGPKLFTLLFGSRTAHPHMLSATALLLWRNSLAISQTFQVCPNGAKLYGSIPGPAQNSMHAESKQNG